MALRDHDRPIERASLHEYNSIRKDGSRGTDVDWVPAAPLQSRVGASERQSVG